MTSHQSHHEIDEEGAPVANAESPSTLDAETLQQWQSELDGFVTQIRHRLQSLSDSLAQPTNTQPSIVSETPVVADPSATAENQTIEPDTDPPDFPESVWGASEPQEPSLDPDPANDADPLARLKLRLAQQIENT